MYLLRLAFRPWRLAPFSQLLSAVAVGILLLITGLVFWVDHGLNPVLAQLQNNQVITAYFSASVKKTDEQKLVDRIRASLGSQAVQDLSYTNGDQFLAELKDRYPELVNEVESLGVEEAEQVVPKYVSIAGVLDDATLEGLRKIPGVELVESSKDRYEQVIAAFIALSWVTKLFMGGLGLALLTGLVHLSRVNSHFYKEVLSFLRLWGATRTGILIPGAVSGMMVGLLGGLLACVTWYFSSEWFAGRLRELSPALRALPMIAPAMGFLLLAAGGLLGASAGMLAGWWASAPQTGRSGFGGRNWL